MSYVQETRERGHRGTRRGRSPPHYVREDPKEEGELQDTGSANKGFQTEGKTSTSNNPQHESNGAKVNLVKVPPKPLGLENGAKAVIASETVGAGEEMAPPLVDIGKDNTGNEVMDLEETGNPIAGDEGFMCEDDDFQNLTDGEMEDLNGSQEVVLETVEEESRPKETEEKGLQVGEEEKKKGARKLLLKQTMAAGTSKKKKFRHSFHRTEMFKLDKERYEGDMESMASWFVGMRSSYLIQWMMDLISLNQAQWKNGIRMVLDKGYRSTVVFNHGWRCKVWSYGFVLDHRRGAYSWLGLIKPSAENIWNHEVY
ncbi:PREDICTED: uncharacterized protein LOC106344032 [Brassica oleracea var. oleracea]|uniref:Uncharacterized protein n=1 Tax=Brassica oleracea var. oleracea TaxID=109376 RepID=A0A0D3CHF5_BRAOL|nr:PREDICTED: uncharacterized protein LOC106344032 [Brassica oleracea var. oleracea]